MAASVIIVSCRVQLQVHYHGSSIAMSLSKSFTLAVYAKFRKKMVEMFIFFIPKVKFMFEEFLWKK